MNDTAILQESIIFVRTGTCMFIYVFFKFWKDLLQSHNKELERYGGEGPRSGYYQRGLYLYL